jgi:ubiquinone/menaquinone biosynthesis C-methylase UbiE
MSTRVQDHYGSAAIVERILAAVPWTAADDVPLEAARLFPFDQLHGRELLATRDHGAKLDPARSAHLLDVGSGIGGPARYFASVFGCRVTGIDLTPQFVAAASELTRLTGLAGKVDFLEADAADMPFAPDTFDNALCLYVGMNLSDKPAVLRECFRVLKPGATLLWTEVTSRPGTPQYPLPWARSATESYLDTRGTLIGHVGASGFDVLTVDDETEAHVELARRMKAAGSGPTPGQRQANAVVLGADFAERRMNYIDGLSRGALASTVIYCRKPVEKEEEPLA